jgi:uncharacterized membrane protein YdbT with pleckstrin-like domain
MGYVDNVLQEGEQVRYRASIHWIVYWPAALAFIAAGVALWYAMFAQRGHYLWLVAAGVLGVVFLALLFREWFNWWTTEIAVTNRRVIYKTGFIRRQTNEMHMDKVESVRVDQSILGRLFDYGDVDVLGTGTGFEPIKTIARPLELRNHITGV